MTAPKSLIRTGLLQANLNHFSAHGGRGTELRFCSKGAIKRYDKVCRPLLMLNRGHANGGIIGLLSIASINMIGKEEMQTTNYGKKKYKRKHKLGQNRHP